MIIIRLFLLILTAGLITSCAPYTQFSIQVLQPAEVSFPPDVREIAFMNHSYELANELLYSKLSEVSESELHILDTAINNKIFEGLTAGIDDSPFFGIQSHAVLDNRRKDTSRFMQPFSKLQLQEIRKATQADAVIVLEYYSAKDTLMGYFTDDGGAIGVMEISSLTAWRTYDLLALKKIDAWMVRDTLHWSAKHVSIEGAIKSLPPLLEAFREAAFQNGYKYSRRISPGWADVDRFLYQAGPVGMKDAAQMAMKGNWDGAEKIWRLMLEDPKDRIRAKAAYNLGVRYEVDDQLDHALKWVNQSYSLHPKKHTLDYLNILLFRQLNQDRLEKQLPGS